MLHNHHHLNIARIRRTSGRGLETFKHSSAPLDIGKAWTEKYRHAVFHFILQRISLCVIPTVRFLPSAWCDSVTLSRKAITPGSEHALILLKASANSTITHTTPLKIHFQFTHFE